MFPLLDTYPLRAEEIVTGMICAATLRIDYWRSPTFDTMCGKIAKWPGHGEAPMSTPVTCLKCWERVLPGENMHGRSR